MAYLERGAELRRDARRPVSGMVSALVVALNYGGTQPDGPVARYARFTDYHRGMGDKLDALRGGVRGELGEVHGRSFVDSGPVLERDLAHRAGLGWFGKNTLLINPTLGSYFFIGALFLDVALQPDDPFATDHCGTCTRCLDACPTQAFPAPGVVDARRCISYQTIENKGIIPRELRAGIGTRIYGCDVCLEVCPWNRFARAGRQLLLSARPGLAALPLTEILQLTPARFAEVFKGTAIKRLKRAGLLRNACVVAGNTGGADLLPLLRALAAHDAAVVRAHAVWAVRRLGAGQQLAVLRATETDASVLAEYEG